LFPRTGASRKTFSACQSTRWGRNRRCPAPRLAPSSSSGPWLSSGCSTALASCLWAWGRAAAAAETRFRERS
jgi:hypothetical protein